MKNILCYGDSNTWGYSPLSKLRYDEKTRWTGVLQKVLGEEFRVIEEGLNGRTTVHNETDRPFRSGVTFLPVVLESHSPLDLIIIMLGTNDLKTKYNSTAFEISQNIKTLCEVAIKCDYNENAQILLVSPTHITETNNIEDNDFLGAIEKSHSLTSYYKKIADDLNLYFYDATKSIQTSSLDGVHWTVKQHRRIGLDLAKTVQKIFTTNSNKA